MASNSTLFVNKFQKGSQENANIGFGAFVGVETYTQKGVAKLTRDTTKRSASVVTDKIVSFAKNSNIVLAQGSSSKVYQSIDDGDTWTNVTGALPTGGGNGAGVIFYNNYWFVFDGGDIYYASTPGTWTLFKPIASTAFAAPFIFPNDGALYFANGNKVGKIFFGTAPTFDPTGSGSSAIVYSNLAGGTFTVGDRITNSLSGATGTVITDNGVANMTASINGNFGAGSMFSNGKGVSATVTSSTSTGYFFSSNWLTLPAQYEVTCISFLPSNFLALGTDSFTDTQACDLFLFNPTLSTYETPLRLYSTGSQGQTGIRQLINRNNILYAVTGGNMCLFSTNAVQFQQIEDFSLRTNWRLSGGAQATFPIFLNPNASAIAVMGNKLLLGASKGSPNTGTGSPYGLFPMGVWTVSFTDGGLSGEASGSSTATQLEFPISTGTVRTSGFNPFSIGAIFPVTDNQALIGWDDNSTFGIDKIDLDTYQNDINTVIIESPMMEIGTALDPTTIENVEILLVNDLLVDQTITAYARSKMSDDYTLLQTFTPAVDGVGDSYKITKNPIGAVQYIQIRIEMSTGGSVTKFTPLLRNVIIK